MSIDYNDFDSLKKAVLIIIAIATVILFFLGFEINHILIFVFVALVASPIFIIQLSDFLEKTHRGKVLLKGFSDEWRMMLKDNVMFYNDLNQKEKKRFEKKILHFLLDYEIKSVDTELLDLDRLLIASSGIIPVFGFADWDYIYLETIIVFEDLFEFNHPFIEEGQLLNGLVNKNGNMFLSKTAVRNGFSYEKDGKNTAIHEFIHLLDMDDGEVDGVPEAIIKSQYIIPWINLMEEEIEKICQDKSILGDYACTNRPEFFAESSVCFFENPRMLSMKHPKLYNMLKNIFNQDMRNRKRKRLHKKQ